MKPESRELIQKLDKNLADIVKVYRHILNVVRKEREILIAADLEELNLNNRSKEAMLIKAKALEGDRLELVNELAELEGLQSPVRLRQLAQHFGGESGERLLKLNSVLKLLLQRVKDFNLQNEELVGRALDSITGGMDSIRDSVGEQPNYKKGGELDESKPGSGRLVSREA